MPRRPIIPATVLLLAAGLATPMLVATLGGAPAAAEDSWNPFKDRDRPPAAARSPRPGAPALPPLDGVASKPWLQPPASPGGPLPEGPGGAPPGGVPYAAPLPSGQPPASGPALAAPAERDRVVERADLAPVLAGDGSGLPLELWRGVDGRAVLEMVKKLDLPARSPALQALWRRLWTTSARAPGSDAEQDRFEALRIEALYRSGLIGPLLAHAKDAAPSRDPLVRALLARARIGGGDRTGGCAQARDLAKGGSAVPQAIRGEMLLLGGYCAAVTGDTGAAMLAADLVRAEGIDAPLPLAALDAVVTGQSLKPALPARLSLMDYRFLELTRGIVPSQALEKAEPALLAALSGPAEAGPGTGHDPVPGAISPPAAALRVVAAERAAQLNAIAPADLAEAYRAYPFDAAALADPLTAAVPAPLRRALLYKAAAGERTPIKRTRIARALLDDARRAGSYAVVAHILADVAADLAPVPEIGWFAETAVEVNLVAGRLDAARRWIDLAGRERAGSLQHWLVLVDIADAQWRGPRGASLVHAESFALHGRLPPGYMHRLATVLDALEYNIPIPLWEAASRTPQPTQGHLPETGVLTELQDAAKKKEFARTVLLVMRTLGTDTADTAHIIALGDSIRALRRAGLEADARRLALEAVLPGWPRATGN